MTSSLTVAFSGVESVLRSNFLPEITLDEDCDYSCALLDLTIIAKSIDDLKKILNSGIKYIKCDIISGSYINGERNHIIHQFTRSTPVVKGETFTEIPKHLNYLPVKIKNLRSIQISLIDQKGKQVDIYSSDIFCRINIKRASERITLKKLTC